MQLNSLLAILIAADVSRSSGAWRFSRESSLLPASFVLLALVIALLNIASDFLSIGPSV